MVAKLLRVQAVRHVRIKRIERLGHHVESAIQDTSLKILSVFHMAVFPSMKMIVDLVQIRIIVRVTQLARLAFLDITWSSIRVERGTVTVHLMVKVVRRVLIKV
jgi:hypothetical protein